MNDLHQGSRRERQKNMTNQGPFIFLMHQDERGFSRSQTWRRVRKYAVPVAFQRVRKQTGQNVKAAGQEREEETAGDHRERRRWAPRSNKSKETGEGQKLHRGMRVSDVEMQSSARRTADVAQQMDRQIRLVQNVRQAPRDSVKKEGYSC